jgi:hypothetical protein
LTQLRCFMVIERGSSILVDTVNCILTVMIIKSKSLPRLHTRACSLHQSGMTSYRTSLIGRAVAALKVVSKLVYLGPGDEDIVWLQTSSICTRASDPIDAIARLPTPRQTCQLRAYRTPRAQL